MHGDTTDISYFFVAGINYRKTDASIRGLFAINHDQYDKLLAHAKAIGIKTVFVLSTCNRTEIYGFANSAYQLIELLCNETKGDALLFSQLAYIKNGTDAIQHLFQVGAGLDSQILGDYEIVGQLKQAVKFSRERNMVGAFLERLVNTVLQSSKTIKNQTALSEGTVSVSFAAIQYIRDNVANLAEKNILVLGIGKMGRNTCKNLVHYLDASRITLINRTPERALALAEELGLGYATMNELPGALAKADIIIVATDAPEPIILKEQLEGLGEKLAIDLSVPFNIDKQVAQIPGVTLVQVDELSQLKDATLARRQLEVPKALAIINSHLTEFTGWYEMYKQLNVLTAVKNKLKEIHASSFSDQTTTLCVHGNADKKIQQVINGMATKMRVKNQRGCHYIEAINEFITAGTN